MVDIVRYIWHIVVGIIYLAFMLINEAMMYVSYPYSIVNA